MKRWRSLRGIEKKNKKKQKKKKIIKEWYVHLPLSLALSDWIEFANNVYNIILESIPSIKALWIGREANFNNLCFFINLSSLVCLLRKIKRKIHKQQKHKDIELITAAIIIAVKFKTDDVRVVTTTTFLHVKNEKTVENIIEIVML